MLYWLYWYKSAHFTGFTCTKVHTLTRLRRGAQSYKDFFAKAEFWLRPYGLFCYFRDLFGTANPDE